jgi:hypothetical protein
MNERALHKIRQVRQRYILYHLLADLCAAGTIAAVIGIVLHFLFGFSPLVAPALFVIISCAYILVRRIWTLNNAAVAGFLDASYPELEESSGLVLAEPGDLNLLQQLQLHKVADAIEQIPALHQKFKKRLYVSVILLICSVGLAFLVNRLNYSLPFGNRSLDISISGNKPAKEILLPQIESAEIIIAPPDYTHLDRRKQDKFTLEVVEGAIVDWKLTTNIAVQKVSLLFNDQESLSLVSSTDNKTEWSAKKTIDRAGFYQVLIDGKRSDLYLLQVIKDAPPVIQIKSPKQYTYIDAGEKPVVNVKISVNDDYGVTGATIFATVAKGSGEAVKFKEQKIGFGADFSKALQSYELEKSISLPSLGLEPGDELYFYVQANDNHEQSARTDVYIVSIQDTAQLMSMDGILSGINIKPEYFRSERQIILDAEALIKAKDTLKIQQFKDRSNDLGTDQKLLRLRYGKLLGEESEDIIGDPRLEGKDKTADPKDFGNGAKILDEFTDKHDNAEDAQFFDPTVKAQLKATLTEMWKAELQLRLYQPQEALPFAYKALRLLKDLQQKSRSFVAKTAYNPTPLKMDKRLTGDLDKIIQPSDQDEFKQPDDEFAQLKSAIMVLQRLQIEKAVGSTDHHILQLADEQIAERAALQPGVYLNAAKAMRRIMAGDKKSNAGDAQIVETAIQKILPSAQALPQSSSSSADMGFSKSYFLKLKHINP